MVIKGDFKFELVDANTKEPFREHYHNGETYVEVEPDAEYCLSCQRIGIDYKEPFLLDPLVDGKDIGWQLGFVDDPFKDEQPLYRGAWRSIIRDGQVDTEETALKFVETRIGDGPDAELTLTGKVEFKLYKDGGQPASEPATDNTELASEFARSDETTLASEIATNAKPVRSVEGSSLKKEVHQCAWRYLGDLLETITLHYCTVPGLIKVGILPKPPNIYALHQLLTARNKEPAPLPKLLVQPQQISTERNTNVNGRSVCSEVKYSDLFDLTVLEDTDVEEEADDSHNDDLEGDANSHDTDSEGGDANLNNNTNDEDSPASPLAPGLVTEERAQKKARLEV